MDGSSLAHCKWECQYYIVFISLFRKKKLYGTVREIIKTLCSYKKVEIIAGAVCADHVHLCVRIPQKRSISDFAGYLKGKSELMTYDKNSEMESNWDGSFFARVYFVTTIGNVNEERVIEFIRRQTEESINEEKKTHRPL